MLLGRLFLVHLSSMKEEMIAFLQKERFGSLATLLQNGDPHVATVHFACMPQTLEIIIQTSPESRKCERLLKLGASKASFTTGFEEIKTVVAQFDGDVVLGAITEQKDFYFKKFPEKLIKYKTDVFVIFSPTWWRYTDWTKPEGKTILFSDGTVTVRKK